MLKRNKGFTFIELLMVIVILSILTYISLAEYLDISADARVSAEEAMVGNIKQSLQLYRAERLVQTGTGSYPAALDTATPGSSSPSNPFFTNVLQDAYRDTEWSKDGSGNYTGPAGGTYAYDSVNGSFSKQ